MNAINEFLRALVLFAILISCTFSTQTLESSTKVKFFNDLYDLHFFFVPLYFRFCLYFFNLQIVK